ncbi:MAG: aldehyde dehydrogenase [Synergistaceae bacterium]|jgi:propionaldehyde dehydrogenase|nr:aldehyde dehydrogenase [Synergistaceae bacterium]
MGSMADDEKLVREIARRVAAILGEDGDAEFSVSFGLVDSAVTAAVKAQLAWQWDFSLASRTGIINGARAALLSGESVRELAELSIEETGMGRADDKAAKIRLAIEWTPGPEFFRANALTGDHGLAIEELSPFGVIASLTPSIDPAATAINNAICMISGGNGVVFAPHPSAARTTARAAEMLSAALVKLGAPEGLVSAVSSASLENLEGLMNHESVSLLCVTGGRSAVSSALRSGKPTIAAGPGNPPVLVDSTADLGAAARDLVSGCSFDNNASCVGEKSLFVVHRAADELVGRMTAEGALLLPNPRDVRRLLDVLFKDGRARRSMMGRSAGCMLSKAGISAADARVILVETGESHPFVQEELLAPILPIVRVADFADGLAASVRTERSNRHSAAIHSTNINNMSVMARAIGTALFTKNAPSFSSIGYNGDCPTAFTIATTTGQGPTTPLSFCRTRRCVLSGSFRIV